jgi:integrase/recombinase XerD
MKCVITDQLVLSRAPEGPLSGYVGPFADFLRAQGYALKSIHRQVHLAACFSQWLQQKGVALPVLCHDGVPRLPQRFTAHQRRVFTI